ncbi:MAG: translation elongation factor-like protein [Candidatus Aenigmatarchaeota archaeon]
MEKKKLVGTITHYFTNLGVAVVQLSDTVKKGDEISIEGATTNIRQKIDSMQINKKPVEEAKKGQSIGLKVPDRVRENDKVYKIIAA